MKKYKVLVSRLQYGEVYVEAENEEKAKDKAVERIATNGEDVEWHDAEITDLQTEEVVFI